MTGTTWPGFNVFLRFFMFLRFAMMIQLALCAQAHAAHSDMLHRGSRIPPEAPLRQEGYAAPSWLLRRTLPLRPLTMQAATVPRRWPPDLATHPLDWPVATEAALPTMSLNWPREVVAIEAPPARPLKWPPEVVPHPFEDPDDTPEEPDRQLPPSLPDWDAPTVPHPLDPQESTAAPDEEEPLPKVSTTPQPAPTSPMPDPETAPPEPPNIPPAPPSTPDEGEEPDEGAGEGGKAPPKRKRPRLLFELTSLSVLRITVALISLCVTSRFIFYVLYLRYIAVNQGETPLLAPSIVKTEG